MGVDGIGLDHVSTIPGFDHEADICAQHLRDKLAVQTARLEGRQNTAASAGKNNRKNYNNKKLKKFLAGTGLQKKIRRLLIILSLIIFILLILFVPTVIHDFSFSFPFSANSFIAIK